jgi:uncharacterized protein (TIGR02246 family)
MLRDFLHPFAGTGQYGRLVLTYVVLWLLPFGVTNGRQEAEPDSAKDVAAIESMSAARAKAFNEGDADAIAIHFADDGILMPPGQAAVTGRPAVASYYQTIFEEYAAELTSGYKEVKVSGDLAIGRGYAEVRLTPRAGGESVVSTAKYLNVLQRQPDGSWLTTHDIWNENE